MALTLSVEIAAEPNCGIKCQIRLPVENDWLWARLAAFVGCKDLLAHQASNKEEANHFFGSQWVGDCKQKAANQVLEGDSLKKMLHCASEWHPFGLKIACRLVMLGLWWTKSPHGCLESTPFQLKAVGGG